jgi:alanine dehydrogenase
MSETSLTGVASLPLYLSEDDVSALLTPKDALAAVEACFVRMSRTGVTTLPRKRIPLADGTLSMLAASDAELGVAGVKTYVVGRGGNAVVLVLFDAQRLNTIAVIAADNLGRLRTGAASGIAAKYLAREGARTLGVVGCGFQAPLQVACIRTAVPTVERVVAYCRTAERLEAFCDETSAVPASDPAEPTGQEIVVSITSASGPVVAGDRLQPGSLVCAAGANRPGARELDDRVILRASRIFCDTIETARSEATDLADPVERGLLRWEDVTELSEVVGGRHEGRLSDDEIIVFKSNGLAAWDLAIAVAAVEHALAAGVGRTL